MLLCQGYGGQVGGTTVARNYTFGYDRRSQLTLADITNIGGSTWSVDYSYKKNGDMTDRTINSTQTTFSYTGNLMDAATGGEAFTLDWDDNGQMTTLPDDTVTTGLEYNWDGKLRSATKDNSTIDLRYDPAGNRIYKDSTVNGERKYIVDIVGNLPVILMELDTSDNIKKTYIYANSQILAQHNGNHTDDRYFYLHDRLGSVRQIINDYGNVVMLYTYNPFGEVIESDGSFANPWRFTGQWYDDEIDEYYLRARMYDPVTSRFTSRDPVKGCIEEPLNLHKYLYSINNPINNIDPTGRSLFDLLILNSYYIALDWALQVNDNNPETILDWIPEFNFFRETLVDIEPAMKDLYALIQREGFHKVMKDKGPNMYGYYCGDRNPGPGENPIPKDSIDTGCKAHDKCYGKFGLAGRGSVFGPTVEGRACDKALCKDMRFADCGKAIRQYNARQRDWVL